jgi:hypothetical protein
LSPLVGRKEREFPVIERKVRDCFLKQEEKKGIAPLVRKKETFSCCRKSRI